MARLYVRHTRPVPESPEDQAPTRNFVENDKAQCRVVVSLQTGEQKSFRCASLPILRNGFLVLDVVTPRFNKRMTYGVAHIQGWSEEPIENAIEEEAPEPEEPEAPVDPEAPEEPEAGAPRV